VDRSQTYELFAKTLTCSNKALKPESEINKQSYYIQYGISNYHILISVNRRT